MNQDLARDRQFSYSILNYLRASYQGKLAFINAISQMGLVPEPSENAKTKQALERISTWIQQLYTGECLFSATSDSVESFDAQGALGLLDQLKPEISQLAPDIIQVLSLPELPSDNEVKFLIANLFRNSYARDTYIRGFVEYAKAYGPLEMLKSYEAMLNQSSDMIQAAHDVFNKFRNTGMMVANVEPQFLAGLHFMARPLPVAFRTQLHDINQLLAPFKGGTDYGTLDFSKEEADGWRAVGCGPVPAGYWRAYGMSPEEAQAWVSNKFSEPAMASEWRNAGFQPEDAVPWAIAGFAPDYAMLWFASGFDPERAKDSIDKGVKQPPPQAQKLPAKVTPQDEDTF